MMVYDGREIHPSAYYRYLDHAVICPRMASRSIRTSYEPLPCRHLTLSIASQPLLPYTSTRWRLPFEVLACKSRSFLKGLVARHESTKELRVQGTDRIIELVEKWARFWPNLGSIDGVVRYESSWDMTTIRRVRMGSSYRLLLRYLIFATR